MTVRSYTPIFHLKLIDFAARITPLATLVATFGSLATIDVPTQKGKDGNMYYAFDYQIRLAFASASVEYSCWRDDKRYGAVSAEYD